MLDIKQDRNATDIFEPHSVPAEGGVQEHKPLLWQSGIFTLR